MNTTIPTTHRKALRLPAVTEKAGISKTHVYRLVQAGKFPKPYKLSERVSVWDEATLDKFLTEKSMGGQS